MYLLLPIGICFYWISLPGTIIRIYMDCAVFFCFLLMPIDGGGPLKLMLQTFNNFVLRLLMLFSPEMLALFWASTHMFAVVKAQLHNLEIIMIASFVWLCVRVLTISVAINLILDMFPFNSLPTTNCLNLSLSSLKWTFCQWIRYPIHR